MALQTKFYSLLLKLLVLVFLLVVVMEEPSGCHNGQMRCLYPKETSPLYIQGRKVLVVSKGSSTSTINANEKLVVEELRTVPSGPDPLHHNGGNPKKPTTP